MTTTQERPLYPSAKALLTERDKSVIQHYREMLWQLEFRNRRDALMAERNDLSSTRSDVKGGRPVINPHHAHIKTMKDLEEATDELEAVDDELEQESDELNLTTVCVVLKRDGYLAGIKHAMAALRSGSPERLTALLHSLTDDDQADQTLHELTKDQPDPGSGTWEDYFPHIAPVVVQRRAVAAWEQAAKVRPHYESALAALAAADAALPDAARVQELAAIADPLEYLSPEERAKGCESAGITEKAFWAMSHELSELRKPHYALMYRTFTLRNQLRSLLKEAGAAEEEGGAQA